MAIGAFAAWQFTPLEAASAGARPAAALGPLVATAHSEAAVIRALRLHGPRAGTPSPAGTPARMAGGTPATRNQGTAGAQPAASAQAASQPSAQASPSPSASPSPATAAFTCSGNTPGVLLPENYGTIVTFLVANGYTPVAAAGITGNIYQESGGDPEAVGTGGGGLIGWTPLPAGFVTGNVQADLQTQLQAILTFNQQWAQYIPLLNDASSPAQAAYVYMTDFERPGVLAASNREDAAAAVAQACGIGS